MGPVAQLEVCQMCNHNRPAGHIRFVKVVMKKKFLGHFLPSADSSRAVSRSTDCHYMTLIMLLRHETNLLNYMYTKPAKSKWSDSDRGILLCI